MKKASRLLFLSNNLLSTEKRRTMKIPFEFIGFAFIEGKMYRHFKENNTFVLRYGKAWGNSVVYGAIFAIPDFDFYIRIIDSYHQCSLALLGRNHSLDIHHRISTEATLVHFEDWDDFVRLKYRERRPIEVQAYLGNINHPKIKQRLNKTHSYRIVSGVDKNFKEIFREVTNGRIH